jgi:hypothetical protein
VCAIAQNRRENFSISLPENRCVVIEIQELKAHLAPTKQELVPSILNFLPF